MAVPMAYESQAVARKANAAIAASYRLTMNEQRILLAVLSQVRNSEPITDQKMYFVSASDIVDDRESRGDEFHALKRACNSLFNRVVTIEGVPNGASKLPGVGPLRTRWIQSEVTYFQGQGKIGLRLSHDILPYLNQLRCEFSRIPTRPVMSMTSIHAARIFEMLMQYRDTGVYRVGVDNIRQRLDLKDKYKKFSDFKRNVVEVAVDQINKHAGINVNVDYIKKGKKTEILVFRFERDQLEKLKGKKKKSGVEKKKAKSGSGDSFEAGDDYKQAMMILIENDYREVSLDRVKSVMGMFGVDDPVKAVQRLIAKDNLTR